MISTINGDSKVPFYMKLGNQGLKATEVPVVAFSADEENSAALTTKVMPLHLYVLRSLRSSSLSQPRRELPLATIEAGCIIPEGGMTYVLHHLDLRMSYGSFVLVNH
jgi:hypothetical protein